MTATRFTLTLEPMANDSIPPVLRLRAALKTLLRAHRLRCIDVAEVAPDAPRLRVAHPRGEGSIDRTAPTDEARGVNGSFREGGTPYAVQSIAASSHTKPLRTDRQTRFFALHPSIHREQR